MMSAISTPIKAAKNVIEEVTEQPIEDAKKQLSPMPREMLRMLYWSGSIPPDTKAGLDAKKASMNSSDSKQLNEVREKYANLIGSNQASSPKSEIDQVKNNEENQGLERMKMEHHRDAKEMGNKKEDQMEQEEMQRKRQEEEKLEEEKRAQQASLDNPIEAPGRAQHAPGARKKNATRMKRKPPVSTETRGSTNRE